MSERKQQTNDYSKNEMLSAFIDAELSNIETSQLVDALLNDSEYKAQYIRAQLINDHCQDQMQQSISLGELRNNVALALDDLPAHFSDDAVSLQSVSTEVVPRSNWFKLLFARGAENKMLSGLSVAASVMFVTLFTLQGFSTGSSDKTFVSHQISDSSAGNAIASKQSAASKQSIAAPSLIQSPAALPAHLVSTGRVSTDRNSITSINSTSSTNENNQTIKQQYRWIEADPVLSKQVRQYVNGHEKRRAAYNLQPKLRTATYQVSE